MAQQHASVNVLPLAPAAAPKPLASVPTFPLSPAELQRWNRFANKGGIGKAKAKVDRVSEDGERDLMFLQGDMIIVLMELGEARYLILASGNSPNLAGGFVSPRYPTHSTSASPSFRYGAPSPAPSMTSTATTRTPSLLTSPYSDFADRDADESASSASGHGGSHRYGPFTPDQAAGAWDPRIVHGDAPDSVDLRTGQLETLVEGKEMRPDPTPTTDTFPLHSFPMPAATDSPYALPREPSLAPTPYSSPDVPTDRRRAEPPPSALQPAAGAVRRASHVLSPAGVPVPAQREDPRSAFSFSPNSSIASTLPPSVLSATDLYARREQPKSSDSTDGSAGTSGPNTPGDDPTLAFIFDSYRYSRVNSEMSLAGRGGQSLSEPSSPVVERHARRPSEAVEELADSSADFSWEMPPPSLRPFGAASQLRSRLESSDQQLEPPALASAPLAGADRLASDSFASSSLDGVRIPRMSEIFPRSSTGDSLASIRSGESSSLDLSGLGIGRRGSDDPTARYAMWAPATPTKDWSPRRASGTPESRASAISRRLSRPDEEVLRSPDSAGATPTRPRASPRRQSVPELWSPPRSQVLEPEALGMASLSSREDDVTPPRRQRQASVPVTDAQHLEHDLDASRRLFHSFFQPPQELVDAAASAARAGGRAPAAPAVHDLPSSPRQETPSRPHRKSVKGLKISEPIVPGAQTVAPLWRSQGDASPIQQALPHERGWGEDNVFVSSRTSIQLPPHVAVVDASPSSARIYRTQRTQDDISPFPHAASMARSHTTGSSPSPATASPQTFASAASSPATGSFEDPRPSFDAPHRSGSGAGGPNKLRKALHRTKSSPSLSHHANASSVSLGANQPLPVRQLDEGVDRQIDYSTGISHKDLEEETVHVGKSEFEMVKPYAALLAQAGEEEPSPSLPAHAPSELSSPRPSTSSHRDALVTPRRPAPPSHSTTDISQHSYATAYTAIPEYGRSAASLSHFSPPTPASVEGGGRALDDYRSKEAKWLQALSSMSPSQVRKSKKLRALAQAGVPSSVRGKVWAFLAEAEVDKREGLYQTLCDLGRAPLPLEVEHDLRAVFDHPQFAEGAAGLNDLSCVLQALSRFDPKLGYYPGLASVIALLLTQMPAESAFWTLVSLVKNYALRQYFPSSKAELRVETLAFEYLLDAAEPKIGKRLREAAIPPVEYLSTWHSTLFLSILPHATVLRLVDILFFDPKAHYRIALALLDLSHFDDRLSFPSRDAILNHLLAPPPSAFEPALLIPAVATIKVSDDKVKKAHKKAAQAILRA
ncbi:hypothetical protein Rhopal_004063-T1 [Rhodotorula paludigena]|uniref:Rab-GAP TBC domain-containing protein n=1 Tax=Rhodotorula paludigena TaxID=86838 RepID=A0AAV5GLF8_9BASI|nr:hypothetical protein Rhopal_004063-T1 [Rhodotorula paludigena]